MKNNGNDRREEKYYIGLDVGTESAGWAVTDKNYQLKKCNGKQMWGARLFSEAKDAQERRIARTARRRLERRKVRLGYLEMLFNNQICAKDPTFFRRLHESNLWTIDKSDVADRYSLFNDPDYTDTDYIRQYPTVYHLRSELIHSDEPHDPRLVFLAIHHILKSRGHFLYETSDTDKEKTFVESFGDFCEKLKEFNVSLNMDECEQIREVMFSNDSVSSKKKAMKEVCVFENMEDALLDTESIAFLLSGATVQLSKLFRNDDLKDAEIKSVSLKENLDEKYDQLSSFLQDGTDVIFCAKELYDISMLEKLLGNDAYISDAKIKVYDKNASDLAILKKYFQRQLSEGNLTKEKYDRVFKKSEKKQKLNNFAAYMHQDDENSCSQEDLCKFLKNEAKGMKESSVPEERKVYEEIEAGTFFTKLKGSENGLFPYQLQLKELRKILSNASHYLSFLKEKDKDGISVEDKIISLCTFRIPYYVGPLNKNSKKAWLSRTEEKIYPWNFDRVVNKEESADGFMRKLIGKCTYTGDDVLPKQSLLYSSYIVLNEINNIKVNGQLISVENKQKLYHDLFEENQRKVTLKSLCNYMKCNGMIEEGDEVSGVDKEIHGNLKSYHDFRIILEKTKDPQQVEHIIERMLVYGSDKKMLKNWLVNNTHGLDENDIKHILRLNYKDWGRLSATMLNEIYHVNKEDSEAFSIMDMLWSKEINFMKLMSNDYQFAENAKKYKNEHYGMKETVHERLDDLYIAPSVRRSIWQTLRIVDEVVDIEKAAPDKIFIEMARTSSKEMEKKRTFSRKNQLMTLYESCKEQCNDLIGKLENEDDQSLRRDKLYLYYTQLGKCMYSGHSIDLNKLLNDDTTYDIDHIYPRSKIKDNSIDNRVLVESKYNRDKTNVYPISDDIRKNMLPFWAMLHEKKLISTKKYERLKRNYPLTDDELSSFVARQLVETQQSTKALASMLKDLYPSATIVYSKAGNVTDFRQEFQIPKFRAVNDLHHAKDAYLNIVVGNVYDTKFTKQFFANIDKETYSLNKVFHFNTLGAWIAPTKEEMKAYANNKDTSVLSGTIQTVYKYIFKNTPIVTYAPYRQKGALFDLNIMPKGKGQLPIKNGKEIEKYGGYNKRTGSYFCIVEHTVKKKRIRTIQPVYLDKEKNYRENPIKYCKEELHLAEPRIIVKTVLMGQLFLLDESRLRITGRSDIRILYKHDYQFAIDDKYAMYLKDLDKYIVRCEKNKKVLKIVPWDHISMEENVAVYDWFIERMNAQVYQRLFKNMQKDLVDCRDKFIAMDALQQAKTLLEILKTFKCDRTITSLKELNGKGTAGVIRFSNNLSNCKTAILINESITGLYETKVNLLGD